MAQRKPLFETVTVEPGSGHMWAQWNTTTPMAWHMYQKYVDQMRQAHAQAARRLAIACEASKAYFNSSWIFSAWIRMSDKEPYIHRGYEVYDVVAALREVGFGVGNLDYFPAPQYGAYDYYRIHIVRFADPKRPDYAL